MFRTELVFLALIVSCLIGSVLSLKCYKENPDLAEYNKPDPNKDKPDCVDSAKSCVSAITTLKGKPVSITKGCSTSSVMGCSGSGVGDHKAVTCYCNKDMCNTQQPGDVAQLLNNSARSTNAVNTYTSVGFLFGFLSTVLCIF